MKINSSANIINMKQLKLEKTNAKKLAEKQEIKHGFVTGLGYHVTVYGAALRLQCSTRRVRQLLETERLIGFKRGKSWIVKYPLQIQIGIRGPKPKALQNAKRPQKKDSFAFAEADTD